MGILVRLRGTSVYEYKVESVTEGIEEEYVMINFLKDVKEAFPLLKASLCYIK